MSEKLGFNPEKNSSEELEQTRKDFFASFSEKDVPKDQKERAELLREIFYREHSRELWNALAMILDSSNDPIAFEYVKDHLEEWPDWLRMNQGLPGQWWDAANPLNKPPKDESTEVGLQREHRAKLATLLRSLKVASPDLTDIQFVDLMKNEIVQGVLASEGGFYAFRNQLTSLEGSPKTVGGNFFADDNQLTSLKGSPYAVGGSFEVSYNQLTSLEGSPKTVGSDFFADENQLTSLEGSPKTVGRNFSIADNQLISLEGSPKTVVGDFVVSHNQLTSLKGLPEKIGGTLYITENSDLPEAEIMALKHREQLNGVRVVSDYGTFVIGKEE